MAGKYTKQGVFPVILDGSEEISANKTWGNTTEKVGLIKINGNHVLTFKSTDFLPENSGDSVFVTAIGGTGTASINIDPDPFVSADDLVSLSVGESIWLMYHHDHGWLPMGNVTLA